MPATAGMTHGELISSWREGFGRDDELERRHVVPNVGPSQGAHSV
jgi:hypothetical protein